MVTNDELAHSQLELGITLYLGKYETREEMLNKFNGDKARLVKFLRERELAQYASDYSPKKNRIEPEVKEEKLATDTQVSSATEAEQEPTIITPAPAQASESKEKSSTVKYVEPVTKKKWSKKKEKESDDKNQSSLF